MNSHFRSKTHVNKSETLPALLLNWQDSKIEKLGQYVGRLTWASYFAGNPVSLLLTAIALGHVCHRLWHGASVGHTVDGLLTGGLSAATFFAVTAQFTGPLLTMFMGVVAAAATCYAVTWLYQRVRFSLQQDLDHILAAQFAGYRADYQRLP